MKTIEITVPGSKSLTNRALILAGLSDGISIIKGWSKSDDSLILIKMLKKLGIVIIKNKDKLKITGNNGNFKAFNGSLDVGDAGTAMRFLTALTSLVPGKIIIKGSKRLNERPIIKLKEALKKVKTGKVKINGNISSQFISSLLMIAPVLKKGLEINVIGKLVSKSYVDMTINLLNKFGVEIINQHDKKFIIRKNQKIKPIVYEVEGDASGASYFWAISAITGKKIKVKNINPLSSQGDVRLVDVLQKMGCKVIKNTKKSWIQIEGQRKLKGITVNMDQMPDTAQTLAVVAAFAKGETKIIGLSTLKIKETDRLQALKNELTKIKIKSKITGDLITIVGGNPQKAVIETYGDHRMAMAFAVAGTKIPGIIIKNPEVVSKSFPDFWEKLNLISHPKGVQIFLIGFMGSGKSSVAKALAKKLNCSFIEIDNLVLEKSKRNNISEIFSIDGEEHFRNLETEVAKDISDINNIVVSTGGGIVMKERNQKYLEKGKVFFLKTSFETLEKRLFGDDTRPLFKNKIKARKLFDLRQNIYEKWANHIVLTDKKNVEKIVINLLNKL